VWRRACAEAGLIDQTKEKLMSQTQTLPVLRDAPALRRRIGGRVIAPGEPGWDAARGGFNLRVDQRPAMIAFPRSAEEVSATVRFAARTDLRVAPQRTGHNAAPLGPLGETILLKTDGLDRVHIDRGGRVARVGGGARWADVVPAASGLGLAALHGSTSDISVAGYTLGGGMGWYARKFGLASNSVVAFEIVTADGEIRSVDADHEPELFWALRGGGGNFGVVTALEFELYPLETVHAGALFFPVERAGEVLHAWHEWTATVPEEVTSIGRLLQFPPLEMVPEPFRGKSFALVEAVFLGGEAEAAVLLAPLRRLGPTMDTFATVPPVGITELHMDPHDPVPAASTHAMLGELPATAIDELVAAAGPDSGSTLASFEIRHAGGALARVPDGAGALATLPGSYAMFAGGLADPVGETRTAEDLDRVAAAARPYAVGQYLNFVERRADADGFFEPGVAARLRSAREDYDPTRLIQANHEIGGGR
jgi:hypothetical protein